MGFGYSLSVAASAPTIVDVVVESDVDVVDVVDPGFTVTRTVFVYTLCALESLTEAQ